MKTILLVQDALTNILLTTELESSGFEVVQTSSFKEAQENLESGTNDECFMAIIDINLEDTKDNKIIDYMSQRDIKTIIYSNDTQNNMREFLKQPVLDFIIKQNSEDIKFISKIIKQTQLYQELNMLIVQNDTNVMIELEDFIKPLGFKNIFHSKNGIEALEQIKKEKNISLVLTDYNMPQMDGLELIQNIRKMYSTDKLTIISITDDMETDIYIQFLKLGINNFFKKPYMKNHLNTIVHNSMENLFAQQKELKQKKDLGAFVRKIKTDNMANTRKYEQDIIDLTVSLTKLKREKDLIEKDKDNLKAKFELTNMKLIKQIEQLGMKQGDFVANAIDNSIK
jgi:DNA-binding NtrC family response regulator